MINEKIKNEITSSIISIENGATILQIEKCVSFERHTLSKYLYLMEGEGLIFHKPVGKAKLWFANKAPIHSILSYKTKKNTFIEKVLSNIISSMPGGVIVIDDDLKIQFMNDNAVDNYGFLEGKEFGKMFFDKKGSKGLKRVVEMIKKKKFNEDFIVKDGFDRFINIRLSRIKNPDSSYSIILLVENITSRIEMETEFAAQKKLLEAERNALNKAVIMVETDLDGKMTYVNDKFVKVSGYDRKDLIGETHRIVKSGYHSKKFYKNLWEKIGSGKVWHGKIKNKTKKGEEYWLESAIAPVLNSKGKPIKYITVRFDVSK